MKNILLLILLMLPTFGWSHCYYVATTGNDTTGNGTSSTPYRSIKKAYDQTSAGDTVYIREGTYKPNVQQSLTGKNGTAGNLIKVWAYPGEIPIISRGTGYPDNYGMFFTGNYIHFKGFEITGYTQSSEPFPTGSNPTYAMLSIGSNNCIWENLNIHHNGTGLYIQGGWSNEGVSTGNLILNCDFHHNQDPYTPSPNTYGNASGMSINRISAGCVNTVKGCRSWWNTDEGIDTWRNDGIVNFSNTWCFFNGYLPDTFTQTAGNGCGFKLGYCYNTHDTTSIRNVNNCVAFKNKFHGFDDNSSNGLTPPAMPYRVKMYNNTAYRNGVALSNGKGFNFAYGTFAHIAKNNIDYLNNSSINFNANTVHSNNTWDGGGTITKDDFISLDSTQLVRARKPDGSLPDIIFLNLISGSDLINAGTKIGTIGYVGTLPDLGAFEFVPAMTAKQVRWNGKREVLTGRQIK